ncbi:response regulator [Leptolyngbya ohadii]|uniref:response regulator n=1 Tax=Leptolyngbya ohadii TaxID=1962290 RepID=UPI000B59C94C|nr:response regulator [Leptolyngbya ohadii]
MMPKFILLVEDNLTNQKIICKQLATLGYQVETVGDGESAVEAVKRQQYDVILMDCQLPGIDGFEATLAIRQQEQMLHSDFAQSFTQSIHPSATIIAMTASDLPEDQERAIAAGMNDYIQKPIQRERLEVVLARWIQKAEAIETVQSSVFSPIPQSGLSLESLPLAAYLDLHYLHQLSDNCAEFELELLQIFLQDSREHLFILRQAIAQKNNSVAEQAAHHLHGASANIGAKLIRWAAAALEQQAHQQKLQSADLSAAQSAESLLATIEASLRHIQGYVAQAILEMPPVDRHP